MTTTTTSQSDNETKLRGLLAQSGGDLYKAIRIYTECTTRELAEKLGHSRRTLGQALKYEREDATYSGVLRSVEASLDVPQNSLDGMR